MSIVHYLVTSALIVSLAYAQANQGGISGDVTDESGATITGAKVVVVNRNTGLRQEALTTEGGFRFPSLPVGLYEISVSREGFANATRTGILVEIGSTTSVTISLR